MSDAPEALAMIDVRLLVRRDGVDVRVEISNMKDGSIGEALDEALGKAMENLQDELRREIDRIKRDENIAALIAHRAKADAT